MKRYTTIPGVGAIVVAALLSFIPSIPAWISSVLLLGAIIFCLYWTRGNMYYGKAVKALKRSGQNKAKDEEVKALFEKALKAGLPGQYTVIASSVLLAKGSNQVAADALTPLTESSDRKIRAQAKTALSMHYWFLGDMEEAIRLSESAVEEDGAKDRNTYINLCCYYLRAGKAEKFRKTVNEISDNSPAFQHFKAVAYLMESKFREAGIMLEEMFSHANPSYPDPYINYALVYLHYGRLKKAEELAATALQASSIMDLAVYQRDFTEGFHSGLSDPYRRIPMMNAVGKNLKQVMIGKLPEVEAADEPFDGDVAPDAPELPSFSEEKIGKKRTEDVSTDLTSSDEEWIRTHGE